MPFFLQFIRFPNLIIVVLSQYLLRYCLIERVLATNPLEGIHSSVFWQNNELNFLLFVGMTVAAAAAGYVINDIIDEKIDALNKPEKQFVGVRISSNKAWVCYFSFVFLGFLMATWLSFRSDYQGWVLYYSSASMLLFAYSKWLKKRVLIGNIVVAIFTACVAWGIALPLITTPAVANSMAYKLTLETLVLYCFFAFFSNLWREIIKDLEDIEGDAAHECRTLPIVLGVEKTKLVAHFVCFLLIILLIFFIKKLIFWHQTLLCNTIPNIIWLTSCVLFPCIYVLYLQYFAQKKQDFHHISSILKAIMVSGLLFLVVFRFFMNF